MSVNFPVKTVSFIVMTLALHMINYQLIGSVVKENVLDLIYYSKKFGFDDAEGFYSIFNISLSAIESVIILILAVYFFRKHKSRV